MEGVTYSMRDSLEIIEGLGVPVRQIRASGGGSRSPLWRQIQADVFGRKVVTINSEEGAAYGVALLAAVARGRLQEHRRSLHGRHPRRARNVGQPAGQEVLRSGVPHLSAALPVAEGGFQKHRGVGRMRDLGISGFRDENSREPTAPGAPPTDSESHRFHRELLAPGYLLTRSSR